MAENSRQNGTVLTVRDLRTYFHLEEGVLKAVDGVSFSVGEGEIVGILGESGCGKSVTAHSILRLVPEPGRTRGSVRLRRPGGQMSELLELEPGGREIRRIRGGEVSMVFQEPMTSLSPVHTVRSQIMEAVRLHCPELDKGEAEERALDALDRVGIPRPKETIEKYSHQLSGGLRQRAMIAIALVTSPTVLIADEPTTALDVTVQAQILKLLKDLQEQMGLSVIYITHSLPVISEIADRVLVMYLGKVVEYGDVETIFQDPQHPYTQGLMKAIPKLGKKEPGTLYTIKGTVPLPLELPAQCGFYDRCPHAMEGRCNVQNPAMIETEQEHGVRCLLYADE
jgi:oligopeptide/dipeptide ABC transporter ATP-binding protein